MWWRTPVEIPMTESTTNRAMRRLVDCPLLAKDPEAGKVKMSKSTRRDLLGWGTATASAPAPAGVEILDEQGNLVNILDKPEWRDVVSLPRNRDRVMFRSRFPDYVGSFVNHCHILLHEDHAMMGMVQAVV